MRAEAGLGVRAVKLLYHLVQRALQIAHGDAAINGHALDLVEHGGMGGVHLILAVDAARRNDADGQGARLHGMHLHGAGLGAQQDGAVLGEIEGVTPLPGGVPFLHVQLREVIVGKLHLTVFENVKAHADEDALDLI